MIKAINHTHVRQECGNCHALNEVDSADFIMGVGSPGHFAFPPCPNCGAIEFCRREGANSNPDDFDSEHCGAVNMAHRLGVERGKVHPQADPDVKAILAQEKGRGRWVHQPRRRVEPSDATFIPVRSEEDEFAPVAPAHSVRETLARLRDEGKLS